jgi:hypothetical protein
MCSDASSHRTPCGSQALISVAMATALWNTGLSYDIIYVYVAIRFLVRLLRQFRRLYVVFDIVFTTSYRQKTAY